MEHMFHARVDPSACVVPRGSRRAKLRWEDPAILGMSGVPSVMNYCFQTAVALGRVVDLLKLLVPHGSSGPYHHKCGLPSGAIKSSPIVPDWITHPSEPEEYAIVLRPGEAVFIIGRRCNLP